jgi:hypothetical protein
MERAPFFPLQPRCIELLNQWEAVISYLVVLTGVVLLLCLFRGQLAPDLASENGQMSIAKRQEVMVWTMIKKWNDDKARAARLNMPIEAWLSEKLPSIARHDPDWFEKQGRPTTPAEEEKLISDAVQRALDVTDFWARRADMRVQDGDVEEAVED